MLRSLKNCCSLSAFIRTIINLLQEKMLKFSLVIDNTPLYIYFAFMAYQDVGYKIDYNRIIFTYKSTLFKYKCLKNYRTWLGLHDTLKLYDQFLVKGIVFKLNNFAIKTWHRLFFALLFHCQLTANYSNILLFSNIFLNCIWKHSIVNVK